MVPPPSSREGLICSDFSAFEALMASDPDRLRDLEKRLGQFQARQAPKGAPPSQAGIAGRFATELVAALIVGGGLGWGIDWLLGRLGFRTAPVFMLIFFILGAAAGILNVVRAAREINAQIAQGTDPGRSDEETGS